MKKKTERKMKGKKFDAAQQHFLVKEGKLRSAISSLQFALLEKNAQLEQANNKIAELQSENERLKDWVERLLKYTELSEDDIKKACEKDKMLADLLNLFRMI